MKLFTCGAALTFFGGICLAGCGDSNSNPGAAGANSLGGTETGGGGSSNSAGSNSAGTHSGGATAGGTAAGGTTAGGTTAGGTAAGGTTAGGTTAGGEGGAVDSSCTPNPCVHGTCEDSSASGSGFSCTCDTGFTGDRCDQVAPDACSTNPCQNGGTCALNGSGAAVCACAAGYSGDTCGTNIDDCASNPCVNGGTCVDAVNDFSCTCAAGYSGKTCSNNIDDCATSPCVNGGTCVDAVNDFSCTCAAGYTGKTCATNIDDCASHPCLNGGTCVDGVNSFTCTCAAGYSGGTCATNIDDCASHPCLNGGTCVDGVNSFTCTCAAGYSGDTCETVTTPASCKAIKLANPAATDGTYTIDPDGSGPFGSLSVWCDMTTDGGGYTSYNVDDGLDTARFDDPNSCSAVGLQMVVPRTLAHLNALYAKYGSSYFQFVPGIYGLAAGDYTGCAMNSSDATCAANWKAIDGGAWFAMTDPYSEPNGDYTPGCWLGTDGSDINPPEGFGRINDENCDYDSTRYICSDNAK